MVLREWEIWSLTLRDEHSLNVFLNRALRRMIRLKKDEVAGGRRKLQIKELHNFENLKSSNAGYIIRITGFLDFVHCPEF
jgi:hypothetical protein